MQINTLKKVSNRNWAFYFLSLSVLAVLCFAWLILIPSDSKGTILFGFSPARLALSSLLLIQFLVFSFLAWKVNVDQQWWHLLKDSRKMVWLIKQFHYLVVGCILASSLALKALPLYRNGLYFEIYRRLLPLISWILGFGIFSAIFISHNLSRSNKIFWKKQLTVLKWALFMMLIFFALWAVISISRYGTIPDSAYWDSALPIPLLEGQLIGFFYLFTAFILVEEITKGLTSHLSTNKKKRIKRYFIDLVIILIIWLIAFFSWSKEPIPNTYFTPKVRPPNYEVYPFSDARLYDTDAQSFLIGELSQNDNVIHKPLHVYYLSILHLFVGQDYRQVILLQTAILAFNPLIIYFLGKNIHSRLMGFGAAGFFILREWNTLKVSSLVTTSNTKLLMSELPATMFILVLTYVCVLWVRQRGNNKTLLFLLGVILGFTVLYRSQSLLLIPLIIFLCLFVYKKSSKTILIAIGTFLFGVFLVLTPWLIRNWYLLGELAIEDPKYTQVVIDRYSYDLGGDEITYENQLSNKGGFFMDAFLFTIKNPRVVFEFASNQFLHNELLSALIIPMRPEPVSNLSDSLILKNVFWKGWGYELTLLQKAYLSVFLCIISIGVGSVIRYSGFPGIIPLAIHFFYNLSIGLSRISGWRFILPVDWVFFFYFSAGLIQLVVLLFIFCGFNLQESQLIIPYQRVRKQKSRTSKNTIMTFILIGVMALFLSASFPIAVATAPSKYSHQTSKLLSKELVKCLASPPYTSIKDQVTRILSDKNIEIIKGIAYYPRFYPTNDGEPTISDTAHAPKKYPRQMFLLIGKDRRNVELRVDKPPIFLPNASEVIVAGYKEGDVFRATLVFVVDSMPFYYFGM
ncbi:MAG TPA: hypothetical protein G4N92_03035 [Anaerolineae bacterium]|nr:hypothetical protein [Anaerolineae bacterium]